MVRVLRRNYSEPIQKTDYDFGPGDYAYSDSDMPADPDGDKAVVVVAPAPVAPAPVATLAVPLIPYVHSVPYGITYSDGIACTAPPQPHNPTCPASRSLSSRHVCAYCPCVFVTCHLPPPCSCSVPTHSAGHVGWPPSCRSGGKAGCWT